MLNRLAELARLRPTLDEALLKVSPAGATDLHQLPVGTELQARVAAALPNRVYQVVVGDRTYTLPLPIDARPGDEIQLTVVERDARGAAPTAGRPAAPDGAAVTTLSPTARFITTLLNTPAQAPLAGLARTSRPLLPAPPAETAAVATRLSKALAESGIFYESHQAQWLAGERSLAQLMQEPQAHMPPLPPVETATPSGAGARAASMTALDPGAAPHLEAPVHPALLSIVREQLQTLSTLQIAWQGQVWPGQEMYWEIAEETPERERGTDAPGSWQTRLKLRLPRLGDVRATVSIGAAGVGVVLAAASGSTASAMSANGGALRSALAAAGLRPASFKVERARVDRG
jgi:hypothetical protein